MTNEQRRQSNRLRWALRVNAVSSASFGLLGLAIPGRVVDLLDAGNVTIVRLVAAGLLGFAAFVAWISTRDVEALHRESLMISTGDLGWIAASVVLVAIGVSSTGGIVATLLVVVWIGRIAGRALRRETEKLEDAA